MRRGFAGWRVCQTRAIEPHGHVRHAQAHAHLLKRFGHDGPPANNQSPKKCDIFYWDGGQGKLGPEKVETSGPISPAFLCRSGHLSTHIMAARMALLVLCAAGAAALSARESVELPCILLLLRTPC